jgi:hypothetical protein
MRYKVSSDILDGFSSDTDSAAAAIKKANELLGGGLTQVTITDTQSGQIYRHEEFQSLVAGK